MPRFRHQLLVELFRNRGELAPALLEACGYATLDHDRVAQASIDLSQIVSTEYRADAVVELRDQRDRVVGAIIVEVQTCVDRGKPRTWPVYLAGLRAKLGCPVVLLVVAPDPAVARWARRTIELGHPGAQLTPIVISFDDVPRVMDRGLARRLPELAVLSTMAHGEAEVARVAISAANRTPRDVKQLYLDVILAALPLAQRRKLEATMEGYVYQSAFARKYYFAGEKRGLEKGRARGRAEGKAEGKLHGLRRAVMALLRGRLGRVTATERARVQALADERVLTSLIDALVRAPGAREVRAALAAALSGSSARPRLSSP